MTKFHTVEEVAEILKVTEWTVREWCRLGKLKASKPGKSWLITHDDLLEFTRARHG